MSNIRIPVDLNSDKNITFSLEQDFDSLDILSMTIDSADVYSRMSSDYGVLVGRVNINGGFGVQNVKVSVFVPIADGDRNRPEITKLYPFETINSSYPNGVRYNLLPRIKQKNPSHKPVGTFPVLSDLTHHTTYVEVYEKYYKFTTTTNFAGDYMIYGVPLGLQTVHIDFDLFDTESFTVTANDLAATTTFYDKLKDDIDDTDIDPNQIEGFRYFGNGQYEVTPKTDLNSMPNIFSENKQVNIVSFWGDENFTTLGVTRCDFSIDYELRPTAVFFGSFMSYDPNYVINSNYEVSGNFGSYDNNIQDLRPNMMNEILPTKSLKLVVYSQNQSTKEFGSVQRLGVFDAIADDSGVFKINLPMYDNYYITNEFGQVIPSEDEGVGIPTTGRYTFELFEADEVNSGRRGTPNEGYNKSLLAGFRIPATNSGDKFLGGWRRTWADDSVFSYDIKNAKQRFYTIKTTYRKHSPNDLLSSGAGTVIDYLPRQMTNNTGYTANFPLEYNNLPDTPYIIGSAIIPRFRFNPSTKNNQISLEGPKRLLSIPWISPNDANGVILRDYEYLLGIGVRADGTNKIGIWDNLFGDKTIENNPQINGFNFGDNPSDGIPVTPHTYSTLLATNEDAIAYGAQEELLEAFEVHPHYNLAVNNTNTMMVAISSTENEEKQRLMEFNVVDITDDIIDLIKESVYSSYNKGEDNQFNGKYYLFGKENEQNALWWIEKEFKING